jgi:hypothetical protein
VPHRQLTRKTKEYFQTTSLSSCLPSLSKSPPPRRPQSSCCTDFSLDTSPLSLLDLCELNALPRRRSCSSRRLFPVGSAVARSLRFPPRELPCDLTCLSRYGDFCGNWVSARRTSRYVITSCLYCLLVLTAILSCSFLDGSLRCPYLGSSLPFLRQVSRGRTLPNDDRRLIHLSPSPDSFFQKIFAGKTDAFSKILQIVAMQLIQVCPPPLPIFESSS